MEVFDQNRKHMELRNQKTGTAAGFTVPCVVGLSEAATRGVV